MLWLAHEVDLSNNPSLILRKSGQCVANLHCTLAVLNARIESWRGVRDEHRVFRIDLGPLSTLKMVDSAVAQW